MCGHDTVYVRYVWTRQGPNLGGAALASGDGALTQLAVGVAPPRVEVAVKVDGGRVVPA